MPEGPETEVVRRTLEPRVVGKEVTGSWSSGKGLRGVPVSPKALRRLHGESIERVERHGKRLAVLFGEQPLLVQLGMTGRLVVQARGEEQPAHTHVRLELGDEVLLYADARRFGTVRVGGTWPPEDLGPDVLALNRKPARRAVAEGLLRTRRSLKDALLDQRVVAGAGNIYACEALFVAGIDPAVRGVDAADRMEVLLNALLQEARRGVKNGGTSFRDFVDAHGRKGRHQNHLQVFLREGEACNVCGTMIRRIRQGQRSTFFCPKCQS